MMREDAARDELVDHEADGLDGEDEQPAFAGPRLTAEDLTAEAAADAAARHALGDAVPVLGSGLAVPAAEGEEGEMA